MANWDKLTSKGATAMYLVIQQGQISKADHIHPSTLRSLCRRELLEKEGKMYHISYDAALDLSHQFGPRRAGAVDRYRRLYHNLEAAEEVYQRAKQAKANIIAGRSEAGLNFQTREIEHAPIRLIEWDETTDQWCVVSDDGTEWVDQTYGACRDWIRGQLAMPKQCHAVEPA